MGSRKRIVISGYYGFGNTGDEAVLAGILSSLAEVSLDAECTVLSANPAHTIAVHKAACAVHRYDLRGVIAALKKCDLFISGGGSLVQDATSLRSAFYYLAMLKLARTMGRKTMIYAQGVGPLLRRAVRFGTAIEFSKAAAITVRDVDSERLLRDIGVSGRIEVCADPAFLVEPDIECAGVALAQASLGESPVVCVAPRSWPGANPRLAEIAEGVELACALTRSRSMAVPMQEPDDVEAVDVFARSAPICCSGDFRLAKGLICNCSCLVGMRLHSLIFAAGCGVPSVAISYDPKVAAFAESAGMPCIDISTVTARDVQQALCEILSRRDELSGRLRGFAEEMRESALRSARIAKELM